MTQEEAPDVKRLLDDAEMLGLAPKPDAAGYRLDAFLFALGLDDDEWWRLSDLQKRDLFLEAAFRWRRLDSALQKWSGLHPADQPLEAIAALHQRLKERG